MPSPLIIFSVRSDFTIERSDQPVSHRCDSTSISFLVSKSSIDNWKIESIFHNEPETTYLEDSSLAISISFIPLSIISSTELRLATRN